MQLSSNLRLIAAGLLNLHFFCNGAPILRPTTTADLHSLRGLQGRDSPVEVATFLDARGGKRIYEAPPGTVPQIDWSGMYPNRKAPAPQDAQRVKVIITPHSIPL